jgi:hypothetical protein
MVIVRPVPENPKTSCQCAFGIRLRCNKEAPRWGALQCWNACEEGTCGRTECYFSDLSCSSRVWSLRTSSARLRCLIDSRAAASLRSLRAIVVDVKRAREFILVARSVYCELTTHLIPILGRHGFQLLLEKPDPVGVSFASKPPRRFSSMPLENHHRVDNLALRSRPFCRHS